jgi:hypothetical protein
MKLALATFGFSLGSAAAAALFSGQPDHLSRAAALPAAEHRVMAGRVAIPAAEAKSLADRPIKTILDVRGPMSYGEYRWDDKGVPAGAAWVRVDLERQLISVFRSGHEIGTAVILYGADGLPTPTGKFPVLAKLKDHRSSTYDAPMPYTLRLTADGVSIHGSDVRWGFATHGCVGVPTAFAAKLFEAIRSGDDVLIVDAKAPAHSAA